MLPITRANLQNFCRACLRELTLTKETNHNINETARNKNVYPHRICYSCQIKVTTLKGFQNKVITATGVLRLIIEEESDKNNESALLKLKSICRICLKKKSNELYSTEKDKELFSDMFQCSGLHPIAAEVPTELLESTDFLIGDPRFPDALCNKCFATLKSFIEFRAITKHTSEYLKNVLDESDDIATNDTDLILDATIKCEEFLDISDKTEADEQLHLYPSEVLGLNCFYNEQTTNFEPKANNENNFNFLREDVRNCNSEIFGCENYFDATENRSSHDSNIDKEFQLDNNLNFNTKYDNEHDQKHTKVTESLIKKKLRCSKNLSKSYKIKTPRKSLTAHKEKIKNKQKGVKTQSKKNKRNLRGKSKNKLESVTGFVISNSDHDSKNLASKTKVQKGNKDRNVVSNELTIHNETIMSPKDQSQSLVEFKSDFDEHLISDIDSISENQSALGKDPLRDLDESTCDRTVLDSFKTKQTKRIKNNLKEIFKCDKCKKFFRKKIMFEAHIKSVHEEIEKPFTCPHCSQAFRHVNTFKYHIKSSHETSDNIQLHTCSYCQRSYTRSFTLKEHIIAVHEKQKPFKCSLCEKTFGTRTVKHRHEKTHLKEKPFSCDHCEKRYNTKSELNHHIQRHTTIPDLLCSVCKRAQPNMEELKKHVVMHSRQCSTCGKIFTKNFHLREHEKTVHLKMSVKCRFCDLNFVTKKSLKRHELCHTSTDWPETCAACNLYFKSKHSLVMHKKMLHSTDGACG